MEIGANLIILQQKGMTNTYNSLNSYLRNLFGVKVKKIPIDAGLTCPNRDGRVGTGGCIYCDAHGSGTGLSKWFSPEEQAYLFLERFKSKGYKRFILYFQSFSNTYASPERLDKLYSLVGLDKEIVGLAIGTRPDCIDHTKIRVIKKYQERGYFVWVELGLQSAHNETLKFINRGHTFEQFLGAYELLKNEGIPVVVHTIFGLPRENKEMMLQTVRELSKLQVDGIKFHALYVVKKTPLERLFLEGAYRCLEVLDYAELVVKALTLLPPQTVIHRLTSDPPKDLLVAPKWLLNKGKVLQAIHQILIQRQVYQGKFYRD